MEAWNPLCPRTSPDAIHQKVPKLTALKVMSTPSEQIKGAGA
jgi:hypothetical protein